MISLHYLAGFKKVYTEPSNIEQTMSLAMQHQDKNKTTIVTHDLRPLFQSRLRKVKDPQLDH